MPTNTTYGLNTFGIRQKVETLIRATSVSELSNAIQKYDNPIVIGGGSNVLFTDDLSRPILVVDNVGIKILKEDEHHVYVLAEAGTNWHRLVQWAVERKLGGIENLSLIPGKCGAAPMQNIGAYGVELKDVFVELEAMSLESAERMKFDVKECQLSYRNSIFKNELKEKVLITKIFLRLTRAPFYRVNTSYGAIETELEIRGIKVPTIQDLSEIIIHIRRSKLPDPDVTPNAGSFFKNPVIGVDHYANLVSDFGDVPQYPIDDHLTKVPAGWLIEKCGWKGKKVGKVGTYPKQALVIVNYGVKSGKEILGYSLRIQADVERVFGIKLEREVNVY